MDKMKLKQNGGLMRTVAVLLLFSMLLNPWMTGALRKAEGTENRDPAASPTPVSDDPVGEISETPTPTPSPTPTNIPIILPPDREPAVHEDDPLAESFKEGGFAESSAYILTAYDDGTVIAEKDAELPVYASELNERLFLLYVLTRLELPEGATGSTALISGDTGVVITKKILENAGKRAYPILAGFAEGDVISFRDLVLVYMTTFADDAREALVSFTAGSEAAAVREMQRLARAYGLNNTSVVSTDGAYNKNQYTTACDLYGLFLALRNYADFENNFSKPSVSVNITRGGQQVAATYSNSMYGDVLLYGEVSVPEDFSFVFRISGGCQEGLGAQLMYVKDAAGRGYVTVIANIPFEKDVAIESDRLLSLKGGYYDAPQELPLGDDEVRYKYLLDAAVEYYTMDNRPEAYKTKAQTDRYMMNLTVPVWKMNDATGERYPATATVPINRKLYVSLKAIMEEVYELPMKFPIKVFLGYGYRQSGGVGLSNCTLISVHSYGAAVDINPGDYDNDYFLGKGNDLRDRSNPYCIPDEVIAIFEAHGWNWGGNFEICSDTMHFQYLGLEYLSYQGRDPFITLTTGGDMDIGIIVRNLQDRLTELGFNVASDGIYNNKTRTALMKFQAEYGLPVTGEVDYKTWETLINLTHYMSYVF